MGVQYHAFERKHRAIVAVDLGKMMDYSAIAVIEREQIGNDQWEFKEGNQSYEGSETFYRMRALRRLPLGMDYVSQVKRSPRFCEEFQLRKWIWCWMQRELARRSATSSEMRA